MSSRTDCLSLGTRIVERCSEMESLLICEFPSDAGDGDLNDKCEI